MGVWWGPSAKFSNPFGGIVESHGLIGGSSEASNDRCTTCTMHDIFDTIITTHGWCVAEN